MKTKKFAVGAAFSLCALFAFVSLLAVFGQSEIPISINATDPFMEATNLLEAGKPGKAHQLLASITTNDPEYSVAQCYEALCYCRMTNNLEFLKKMDSPAVSQAAIGPQVREDLTYKYIQTLFFYRKFEKIFPQIEKFRNTYPGSRRFPVVSEYKMAALFERGMKKAFETGNLKNQAQFNKRWTEARSNLKEFLAMTASFGRTRYNYLTNRDLKEDIWRAQIILGNAQKAYASIPTSDTNSQERFDFLQIQLFQKLHPANIDQSIRLMTNYWSKFPPSADRDRVRMKLAEFTFRKGERLTLQAHAEQQSGDTNTAAQLREAAAQNFGQMRSLQSQIVTNRAAGIAKSDVLDSKEDLLYSYYLQKDYNTLLSLASSMVAQSKHGDMDWIVGELYTGIALASLPVPNMAEAKSTLDQVLAVGFKNKPHHDHFVVFAAEWRIRLAQKSGNTDKAVQLVLWVDHSNCTKNIKTAFLKDYSSIAGLPQPN